MRLTTLIATAVGAVMLLAPSLVSGGNGVSQSREQRIAPCKQTVRAVAERRQATWQWEREIDLRRTPTQFREKDANTCKRLRYLKRKWAVRADKRYRLVRTLETEPTAAIRWVFGRYASQAISVAECESDPNRDQDGYVPPSALYASNGQYKGLFQMGESERRLFGHGSTAYEQAIAAKRYFVRSGRDWSPWQCRPGGHLGW